jgi:hypothetical protein
MNNATGQTIPEFAAHMTAGVPVWRGIFPFKDIVIKVHTLL